MLADGELDLDPQPEPAADRECASREPDDSDEPAPPAPQQFGRHAVGAALGAFMRAALPQQAGLFHLWPEHLPALHAWIDLGTQWRVGPVGATGLDYAGVQAYLTLTGLRGEARRQRFEELRIMERATLRAWAARREREQS